MFCRKLMLSALLLGTAGWFSSSLRADTVYLKNGNWIDGIVQPKGTDVIVVTIGELGKVEIQMESVYEIEKNSRTGGESRVPVNSRKLELDAKSGEKSGSDDGEAEDGEGSEEDTKDSKDTEDTGDTREGESEDVDGEEETEDVEDEIDPELKARIEGLVKDLARDKSKYRVRAERHLKKVGSAAVPFLLPLATHESDLARIAVFRLFDGYGDERTIEASIEALADPNEYVRDFAHRTLQKITREDFGYKHLASPRRREYAQKKWRKWWKEEQEALEEIEEQVR
jgi:hypothetical protein